MELKNRLEYLKEVFQRFLEINFMLHGEKCLWTIEI